MRQVLRVEQKSAKLVSEQLGDLPPKHVRVRTAFSAVSVGTEMTTIATRPDGAALGYTASGIVETADPSLPFRSRDRVAVYGAPYVHHASVLDVPATLVTPVAAEVPLELAAFGGIGAIAMHGVRQANLTFGERALVVGLGPVGHLTALILDAAGIDVLCVEPGKARRERAASVGLPVVDALEAVDGVFDAVLLTAHGPDNLLADCAAKLRLRGSIVIVGDLPVAIPREVMFAKEIALSVSRAGGPGRYDPEYEADAHDYPLPYVRWTEGRNLATVVRWMQSRLDLSALVTHTYPVQDAAGAYAKIMADRDTTLGVLFDFRDLA